MALLRRPAAVEGGADSGHRDAATFPPGHVLAGAGGFDLWAVEAMGTVFTFHLKGAGDRMDAVRKVARELEEIENRFSLFRPESEVSRLNRGLVGSVSREMEEVMLLGEAAREASQGYFDPWASGAGFDPTGLVKGLAVERSLKLLLDLGFEEAIANGGGDIALSTAVPEPVGIRHPFVRDALCAVALCSSAIASSGLYERGRHIYNPRGGSLKAVAATVVGAPLWLGDALATALVAAGPSLLPSVGDGFEAFTVDKEGELAFTPGFPFASPRGIATGAPSPLR